ncbi:MAG: LacI family transcriptional regulator [Treponema sp. GWB1_62_6]|nr:MAG: LacI family transcriptional regulator [Treponema sp. GWA1_62_8]OHE66060.1 MAG: LacI family transcriptional regulator [Treponema sp. GWC1_61_84]OHE70997.1 MAG: LacI family transcriptional regulator [Treponema sp. GWB1_62_6]OHE74482.1 MAG: LacI family transcriptional regulator [Treponema sp. RIFOXYC1_FULL_61_9]HCM25663.1 LacI family transcriptional regulator [Treponema sp.]
MVSIKDIAKLAGMSTSTVSRVINQKKYVKPEIRKIILDLVEETGYVPNRAARSMVLQRTFTVGIIAPDTFNMFQRQLFSLIEHRLETFGYRTHFFFVKFEPGSEERCLNRLKSETVDGVIMLHEIADERFYAYLEASGLPAVLATFEREGSGFCAIHVDEEKAARDAVDHLISLGHRRIDLISAGGFSFGGKRAAGYRQALAAAGIAPEEAREIFAPSFSLEAGKTCMKTLLDRGHGITAVFAATDEIAIGAIRMLWEAGLRVPADVSVMGFDDIDISAYLAPGLSTVRQPIAELGEYAANLVHALICDGKAERARIVLPHSLVLRESCAPPR